MEVIQRLFVKIVNIIFLVIVVSLFFMSIRMRCQVNIYTFFRIIEKQNSIVYLFLVATFYAICMCLLKGLVVIKRKYEKFFSSMSYLFIIIGTVICVAWLVFYKSGPIFDQQILFEEARKIAGYSNQEYYNDYFNMYKRQRLVVLIIASLIKIFGDNYYSFRLFNILGAVLLFVGAKKCFEKICENSVYTVLFTVLLCLYYPIAIYVSYIYGTLWSASLSVFGFYYAISFARERRLSYIFSFSISFVLAISMHQSAAISLIAALIYILISSSKKSILRSMLAVLVSVSLLVAFGKSVDAIYEKITSIKSGDALPPIATVAMGLTSQTQDGGPGALNALTTDLYYNNNKKAELVSEASFTIIKGAVNDFISGNRSLSFFVEKTKFQWLDPSFGARKVIICDENNSDLFVSFYNSSIRDRIFKLQHVVLITMYLFAIVAAIYSLINKSIVSPHFLFQLCFIGGFFFSMLWESLSRYCFPYYFWILVEGTYGIVLTHSLFNNRIYKDKLI